MVDNNRRVQLYFDAVNYISVAQLYLKDNFLLKRQLQHSDLKEKFLGHWGTSPGFNFVYAHLNNFIKKNNIYAILVVGTGHAAAAMHANLFLEGAMRNVIPYEKDIDGLKAIIEMFGNTVELQTEITPRLPGVIYEGGELGHAISVAYGASIDNPHQVIFVLIGDGELETGPALAGLNLSRVINPKYSGMVLPIVNLNGFKMSSPSIYSMLEEDELKELFHGLGYEAIIVEKSHVEMAEALEHAYAILIQMKNTSMASELKYIRRPIIVLQTPKGWTGIKKYKGRIIEGAAASHKIPISDFNNEEDLKVLEKWLRGYHPENIIDHDGNINKQILECVPNDEYKLSRNTVSTRGNNTLNIPSAHTWECCVSDCKEYSPMHVLSSYLVEIFNRNQYFKIFSPDELESNQLSFIIKAVNRQYAGFLPINATDCSENGGVIEILSEHVCQGLLQGYTQTGKCGLLITYEAFAPIISSMIIQCIKFLRQQQNTLKKVPSLNYLLTSLSWKNCYSHQNPDILNSLLCNDANFIKIYTPTDANCLLANMEITLNSTNSINFTIASKNPLHVYFSVEDYKKFLTNGYIVWPFYDDIDPDITICSVGDINTSECYIAINKIRELYPNLKIRFVSILELYALKNMTINQLRTVFTDESPILVSFIGSVSLIEFLFRNIHNRNIEFYGYKDCDGVELSKNVLDICGVSNEKIVSNIIRILNI